MGHASRDSRYPDVPPLPLAPYYDPYKPYGYDKSLGIRHVEQLDELLADAYVLSLHCALTDETHHMIDAAAIAKMPRAPIS